MPDIGFAPGTFIPPYPLHFLTIIRYITLLFIIFIVISPREGGGTTFLLLLGVAALLNVADIYGSAVIERRFTIFLIRMMAIVVPILLAGIGTDKSTRQIAIVVATLGVPSATILLFAPFIDPSL